MSPLFRPLLTLVAAACTCSQAAGGDTGPARDGAPAPNAGRVRLDRYGDPLPDGALARLGTTRLRQPDCDYIGAVAFSPGGKLLATAGGVREWDGVVNEEPYRVRLWDPATGKEIRRLGGYEITVRALAFAPDGKTLAVAGDATVLYDVATGKRLRKLGEREGPLAFSPDGKILAAGDEHGTILLRQVATGQVVHRLGAKGDRGTHFTFAAGGKRLIAIGDDRTARVWDPATGRLLRSFRLRHVAGVSFSADGGLWTLSDAENAVDRWDTESGKHTTRIRWKGKRTSTAGLVVAPDGGLVAVVGDASRIRLWETATGRERPRIRVGVGTLGSVTFSPDGRTLVGGMGIDENEDGFSGSSWAQVRLWDTATGDERLPFAAHRHVVEAVAYSPDGRRIASGGLDGTLRLWDAGTGRQRRLLAELPSGVRDIAFSPDGKLLAVLDKAQKIHVLDILSGRPHAEGAGPSTGVLCICFSAAGHLLALRRVENVTRLWDVSAGREVGRLPERGLVPGATAAAVSADGKIVAVAGRRPRVELWDAGTGRLLRELRAARTDKEDEEHGRTIHVDRAGFSPDGRVLAAAGPYGAIYLWDVASGKRLSQFDRQPHTDWVWFNGSAFAFSPDSRTVASAGLSNPVALWEVATGQRVRVFESLLGTGHDQVRALAFSPDGRTLATGLDGDFTVMVWDVARSLEGGAPPPVADRGRLMELAWADLAGPAETADRAFWLLVRTGEPAVALLGRRVQPVATATPELIARLVGELDDRRFAVRRKAVAELERLAEVAEPSLRRALADRPSLEVRVRLTALLAELEPQSGIRLRRRLAVAALEHIGTPAARQELQRLAAGAPSARLTAEAKAALARLGKRRPN